VTGSDELDELVTERRLAGELLGVHVDSSNGSVEFFVPEGEEVRGYPSHVAGLDVTVTPMPRPRYLVEDREKGDDE
jgi:hypothetical protein